MKEFDRFIEEAAAKRCPPGKYWCYDSKKCKKIPLGYHIGNRGYPVSYTHLTLPTNREV